MSKKMWGGRFKKQVDEAFFVFQKSIDVDCRLAEYDVYHSLVHVGALVKSGILKPTEYNRLVQALLAVLKDIKFGKFVADKKAEDIHTDIQNRIEKRVGSLALKLHTLRSRNDQVVFDEKWYCYHESVAILSALNDVLYSFERWAKLYGDLAFPGYTHTQRAQVIAFCGYAGAYHAMFSRDFERIDQFLKSICIFIGAGALAGTTLSQKAYSQAIKDFLELFKGGVGQSPLACARNTLDTVASRDFVVELLGHLSLVQVHLSRFAEDCILYSTQEFGYFDLPEEFCTGSSLMPHKKNPDFLELVRGYSGKVFGNMVSVLTMLKGLPLSYNRDMQLDKEPLFSSVDVVKSQLAILARMVPGIKVCKDRVAAALKDESLYATELAEFLVYEGVAFKEAHTLVGKLVRYAADQKVRISEISNTQLKKFHKSLSQSVISKVMCPRHAVESKKTVKKLVKKTRSRKKNK